MYAILIMAVVQIVLNIILFMKMSGAKAHEGIAKAKAKVCDGDCADEKARAAKAVQQGAAALRNSVPDSAINSAGQVFDSVKPFAAARHAHMAAADHGAAGEAEDEAKNNPAECSAAGKMHKIYRGSSAAAYPAVSFNGTKNMGVNMLSFMPNMNAKPKNPSTADPWGGVNRPAIS